MFLHKDEPFILIYSDKNGKLLSLEDLKIRKRAKKGQVVMTGNEKLEGAISIIEGAVRIRFDDGKMITLHSNDIHLDEPETPLAKMVDQHIDIIYRPREEKSENTKYKEDKKKEEKMQDSLFEVPEDKTFSDGVNEVSNENTETSPKNEKMENSESEKGQEIMEG